MKYSSMSCLADGFLHLDYLNLDIGATKLENIPKKMNEVEIIVEDCLKEIQRLKTCIKETVVKPTHFEPEQDYLDL